MRAAGRCKKLNAESLDAFFSPNFPALATVSTEMLVQTGIVLPPPALPLRLQTAMDKNVLAIRLIPGFDDAPILSLLRSPLKALILELYGAGNAPRKAGLCVALPRAPNGADAAGRQDCGNQGRGGAQRPRRRRLAMRRRLGRPRGVQHGRSTGQCRFVWRPPPKLTW